jgi:DNA repair protein RecO (recombination protein O)
VTSKGSNSRPATQIHGVIVRLQPVRGSDLIVVLLTAAHGMVEAYARSARKPSKRFGGRLEAFVSGAAEVGKSRGSLLTLRSFAPSQRLLPQATGYEQLALASYFAELAIAASQPEHADAMLHNWLLSAAMAAGVCERDELALIKLAGEVSWLAAVGTLADPTACFGCAGSTESGAHWDSGTAGPVCAGCAAPVRTTVGADLLLAVAALGNGVLDPIAARRMADFRPQSIEAAIGARVAELLPRPTRSLRGLQAEFSLALRY